MNLVKVISTSFDKAGRLVTKFLRNGKSDIGEKINAMPFGMDFNPPKDMRAIYAKTEHISDSFVIGYINDNLVSEVGESGLYSTDNDNQLQIYLRLKKDGTIHFGGDDGNLVRYQELKTEFDKLKDDFNDLVSKYNSHIHVTTATIGTGGPGVISATTSTGSPTTADISSSKIDELKTL